jgi:hypothetical protein
MSFRYPPESVADAGRHLTRRRRSKIGNPEGFQIFSGCQKNEPVFKRFFLQPFMPQVHISVHYYGKRRKI